VKLPLQEVEHRALLEELAKWDGYVSSALLAVESVRACGRYGSEYAIQARSWLEGLALMPLNDAVLDLATSLDPAGLRSLDALHLATALSIREEVGALITYDQRLAEAAQGMGLKVLQPIGD
jgi:predicted nucleic acid-binding protein